MTLSLLDRTAGLTVRLAQDEAEVEAAQRLRHRVFVAELGAAPTGDEGGNAKRTASRATRASASQRSASARPSPRVRVRGNSLSAIPVVASPGKIASSARIS